MRKQATTRQYNFPDAELYVQCVEKLKFAVRDSAAIEQYTYSKEKLAAFQQQIQKFNQLPDDDELVGDQMVLTEKKNKAAEKLRNAIRGIMTRVQIKFSNRSGRYRKYGTTKMQTMTDAQLLFCGRRVARVAQQQLDFLADTGLNESQIAKVLDATRQFENTLHLHQDKIADRDIAVESRIEQGNKLYAELINICNVGKDLWADKDPKKYDNYVLYESNNEQKKKTKTTAAQKLPTKGQRKTAKSKI